jgi:hypothetical protein
MQGLPFARPAAPLVVRQGSILRTAVELRTEAVSHVRQTATVVQVVHTNLCSTSGSMTTKLNSDPGSCRFSLRNCKLRQISLTFVPFQMCDRTWLQLILFRLLWCSGVTTCSNCSVRAAACNGLLIGCGGASAGSCSVDSSTEPKTASIIGGVIGAVAVILGAAAAAVIVQRHYTKVERKSMRMDPA